MTRPMTALSRWLIALVFLMTANVAAWAAGRLIPRRWRVPLDGGATLADGSRLLGDHKTWAGLIAGTLACAAVSGLLQRSLLLGAAFGLLSLTGDCASSFIKRRLRFSAAIDIANILLRLRAKRLAMAGGIMSSEPMKE